MARGGSAATGRVAVVWIDSKGARILRWRGRVVTETLDSGVPPRVRGTTHVRRDPTVRHGGSGHGQDDADRHRNEHLRAFLKAVAARLERDTEIEILGTGALGQRLARFLARRPAAPGAQPWITVSRTDELTERQLASRLRMRLGLLSRQPTVGAYRWTGDLPRTAAGAVRGPRRVVEKPRAPLPE